MWILSSSVKLEGMSLALIYSLREMGNISFFKFPSGLMSSVNCCISQLLAFQLSTLAHSTLTGLCEMSGALWYEALPPF